MKKLAIIGAGGMAGYHIAGFRQAGAEVIAIADVNAAAAATTAAKHDIAQSFGDVAEMLNTLTDLDGVSIIVPNKFHAPLAIQAMKAGKHVFCEKPPAISAAEMAELKTVADETGRTLMFNFNNRARPESYAMRGYINDGSVGTINSCQAKWVRRAGIPGFGGWFTNKALSGGGPLIDLLHMIDLGMHFMGYPEPAHVLARTYNDHIDNKAFKGPWGIPDNAKGVMDVEAAAHGFITFKSGQSLAFQVSWAEMNEREECSAIFQGAKGGGMVRRLFGIDGLDETAEDSCQLFTTENGLQVNRDIKVSLDETMGRERSAANFVKTLEGEETPLNTPAEALKLMQVIDAAYASAASGAPVAL
jgi:predicted dehydrogenase